MRVSGKWIVLTMVGLATVLAAYSSWFRWHAIHRSAAFWGREDVRAMRNPESVTAMQLAPKPGATATAERGRVPAARPYRSRYDILQEEAIATAPEATHLMQLFLADRSFEWAAEPPDVQPAAYAMAIHPRGERAAIFLFFPANGSQMQRVIGEAPDPTVLVTTDEMARRLRLFFEKQFPKHGG